MKGIYLYFVNKHLSGWPLVRPKLILRVSFYFLWNKPMCLLPSRLKTINSCFVFFLYDNTINKHVISFEHDYTSHRCHHVCPYESDRHAQIIKSLLCKLLLDLTKAVTYYYFMSVNIKRTRQCQKLNKRDSCR